MEATFICKPFEALTPFQLYEVLRLRSEIFVVEQQCVFLDMDNKDQHSHHLLLYHGEALVAYARLVPAGRSYAEMSIGRVVTSGAVRGTGIGKNLMQEAIAAICRLYGRGPSGSGRSATPADSTKTWGSCRPGRYTMKTASTTSKW
jgi:ElaA protein